MDRATDALINRKKKTQIDRYTNRQVYCETNAQRGIHIDKDRFTERQERQREIQTEREKSVDWN
jgi:cell fate (sporulation/competence/biofilm development) regulator YlbF (YheA/YmcA/DUF963 family)